MPISETHNVDCLEFMRGMADNAYSLAIVDPPYGIGNFIPQNKSKTGKSISSKVEWNNEIPPQIYFAELKRVSREQIIWGANYYNCFNECGGAIIWDKGDANPLFSQCEIASISFQKRVDYIRINWQSGFHRSRIEPIIHACQKPVSLYKFLLKNYAKQGDTIFDSHLGSQSSRIAAYDLGFDFTGCELDREYFDAGNERFARHIAQAKLFEPVQEQPLVQASFL